MKDNCVQSISKRRILRRSFKRPQFNNKKMLGNGDASFAFMFTTIILSSPPWRPQAPSSTGSANPDVPQRGSSSANFNSPDRGRVSPPTPSKKINRTPRSSNANSVDDPPANLHGPETPSSNSTYSPGPDGDPVSASTPPSIVNDASRSGSANPDDPQTAYSNITRPDGPDGDRVPPQTPPMEVDDPSGSDSADSNDPPTASSSLPHPKGPGGASVNMGAAGGTGSRSGATVAGAVMGGLVAAGAGGAGAVVGGVALRVASGRDDRIGRMGRKRELGRMWLSRRRSELWSKSFLRATYVQITCVSYLPLCDFRGFVLVVRS